MPFGGDELNPTEIALGRLPDSIDGYGLSKLLLPVEFGKAAMIACAEYDRLSPAAVIMLGQAGSRRAITPEAVGKNMMDASIPDNAGFMPKEIPIFEDAPYELSSTLPICRIVEALNSVGIPCEISNDAGKYVCNSLTYGMLHHNKGAVPTGFIHVPFIREQVEGVKGREALPFMELDDILKGIEAAVKEVIRTLEE